MIGKVLGERFGPASGQLAEVVIGEVASRLGVSPDDVPSIDFPRVETAVAEVEAQMPEVIALWARGIDGQFALLQAEQSEGGWVSAWRPGWMYLLGLMWVVRLLVVPFLDSTGETNLAEAMPAEIMLTLTGWFLALYMGGHTIKSLGGNAIDAVKAWREGARK
ncbi:MAG: hypothetical protein J0I64_10460 [Devosia sp.]|nr:hypothetical protein [Devosia sp.]